MPPLQKSRKNEWRKVTPYERAPLDIDPVAREVEKKMDILQIYKSSIEFDRILSAKKVSLRPEASFWYPYGTLSNFGHLNALLNGKNRLLLELASGGRAADIGGADGDLAFFLETLGLSVDLIDHGPTNFNGLQGVGLLKEALGSRVEISDVDLDAQFTLPRESYGLVFFLGILYHLKNPFYVLEALSRCAEFCLISTKITRFASDKQTRLAGVPVAYLLDEREANNDPTNFWVFSDAGFRRILKRTGWEIRDYMTVGNTINSDPASPEGDERAFCLVQSRRVAVERA